MATALQQNANALAQILMQRRQQQMQESENAKQNQLRDLQLKQLQREDNYQTGLAGSMSAPGVIQNTTIMPDTQPSLANLMPGNQLQPPQFGGQRPQVGPLASRVKTTETPRSPAAAGAEYALSQGKIEDAVKLFSVDDHVAQLKAKGNLQEYYQAQRELDEGNKFFEVVNRFKENPSQLAAMWPQIQRVFPQQSEGLDPSKIQFGADYTVTPLVVNGQEVPGKAILKQGKSVSVIDTASKPDQEALLDKRFANQQKLQQEQIAAQDRRTAQQIAAADRRSMQKENGPGKILPAGQLESVADMKRVKDVLAEANNDMKSAKVSTGPLTGRLQSLGSKIGMADDSFVNLQQKLQTAQNIMLKLRSGAAVTESEYARFLKEYPTPNDTPEVFKRKMQNTLNYANTLMDDKMQIYEEGGYRVPQSVKSGNKPQGKSVSKPAAKPKRDPLGIL